MERDVSLPPTGERVPAHTSPADNERIRLRSEDAVGTAVAEGRNGIARRLGELGREWDIERALEANAATIALIGVGLGALVSRRWLALPAAVAGFLLQHALQGWCPPVPALRRLGFRTQREIDDERSALKALRGDFAGIDGVAEDGVDGARTALAVARR